MPDHNNRVGRGFDRLAPFYDFVVWVVFGKRLSRFADAAISSLHHSKNCLIVGGGSGEIIRQCFDHAISEQYFYAELSTKMIERTKSRFKDEELSKIQFGNDWESLIGSDKLDLVIFPFVLDCLTENSASKLLKTLRPKLNTNAQILIIDFRELKAKGSFTRNLKNAFIRMLYFFFRFATGIEARSLPNTNRVMIDTGFQVTASKSILDDWITAQYFSLG
jgi:ubiquinone/menaquinone biosynthesis C-methylase UbiE